MILYLNGLANAFAPDINLLAEVGPVFAYFQAKYPMEMAQILLGCSLPTPAEVTQATPVVAVLDGRAHSVRTR